MKAVVCRRTRCNPCEGGGKVYNIDIGARGIEYKYLVDCPYCKGIGSC